jgi:beta-carotene 3-hydroxylase
MRAAVVVLLAFAAMEPITYAAHRWLMHGLAARLHRSHHVNAARAVASRLEANDVFPVAFAGVVLTAFATGFNVVGLSLLVPASAGVTLYGAVYFLVHDVYVHRRIALFSSQPRWLEYLAAEHRRHHRTGAEPYGMLAPWLSGSRPSHEPSDA